MIARCEAGARRRFGGIPLALAVVLTLPAMEGCGARRVTISQDEYINTGVHANRPPEQRTGDPLEVAIVCVSAKDLELTENAGLKPGSGITCKDWYENRPSHAGGAGRYRIPADQIYLLTNDSRAWGQVLGPMLRGARIDGRRAVTLKGVRFKEKLFNRNSVIYVFPKFIGPTGEVLPVPPVAFNPPGAYRSQLACRIGVNGRREHFGQYIVMESERKLRGSREPQ